MPDIAIQRLPSLPVIVALALAVFLPPATAADAVSEEDYLQELPVVMSASRLRQPLEDAPASITVIDSDTIRRTGARSVAELMRLVPGFLVAYFDGAARPYATYHGDSDAFNRHLQVFIDGRSVYSGLLLGSATYGLLGVALEEIERIEVIRGSNSASQGANAYLGVINITTKNANDTVGGRLILGSGNAGAGISDGMARLGWTSGKHAFRISVDNRRDDGFKNRYYKSDRTVINLRADLMPTERDEVSLTAGSFAFDWGSDVSGAAPRTERYRSVYFNGQWRRQLSSDGEVKTGLFFDEEQYFNFFPSLQADGRVRRQGVNVQWLSRLADSLRAVAGMDYVGEAVTSPYLFVAVPDHQSAVLRSFANLEWQLSDRWLINAGGLWERHSEIGSHSSPRYGINYKLSPGHTVRVATTTAYKVPGQFELHGDWRRTNGVQQIRATGIARPERIDVTELGYLGTISPLAMTVDLRAFVEKSRSFLKFNGNPSNIINRDSATQRGWETQLKWTPSSDTQLVVNHTQLRMLTGAGSGTSYNENVPRHFSSVALFQKLPADFDLTIMQSHVEGYAIQNTAQRLPSMHSTNIRLARGFRFAGYSGEAAINLLAADGPYWSYTGTQTLGSRVDRRIFGTVRFDF